MMVIESVFNHVLHIGPNYKDHKGGMGAVIEVYKKNIKDFNFIPSYEGNYNSIRNLPYFLISYFKILFFLLRNDKIKIIHLHGAHNGSFYRKFAIFLLTYYIFKKKIIYHSHGSDFHLFYKNANSFTRSLIKLFFSKVTLVLCLSKKWNEFFENNFDVKSIKILENIIEEVNDVQIEHSNELLTILFLGHIGVRKGIFDLLNVIRLNKYYLNGKILLKIGGNGDVEKLQTFIKENSLQDMVQFEGWITGKKKKDLFLTSDIYILPSYNEGLPISILEAMSYKLPIISTDVGGINEIVFNNENGYLLNPGDLVSLFESLKMFIENPNLINEMGTMSAVIVTPYYSKSVIPKLELIYKQILA